MRPHISATTAVLLTLAFGGASVSAAPCKDVKGRFINCPPAAVAPAARWRNAKGAFAKCCTSGAKPV